MNCNSRTRATSEGATAATFGSRNRRRILAVSLLSIGLALYGCSGVSKKYERKHVQLPPAMQNQPPWTPSARPVPATARRGTTEPISRSRAVREPEYYTGRQLSPGVGSGRAQGQRIRSGGGVTLNFVDTDIREVVDVVLSGALGLNYIMDRRVQGGITARTNSPIPRRNVLPVLENILALNGAAMSNHGGVIQIVPLEAAASLPKVVVTPRRGGQVRGAGAHIIPIHYASVTSLQKVASGLVSPGNQLVADPARNFLIYTGPAGEADTIKEIVATLDVDVLSGLSFALLPLKSSNAADIAEEMETMFISGAIGNLGETVRFLPIERMNAILIVAANPHYLRQLGGWVTRLDRSDGATSRRAFVYQLKNGKAEDMVALLSEIFTPGGGGQQQRQRPRSAIAPGLQPALIRSPDNASASAGQASPNAVDNGDAAVAANGVQAALDAVDDRIRNRPRRSTGQTGIRFVAHNGGNAIVVMATPQEYREIEAVLQRLDEQPEQVLIEATIAEVVLNDNLEYGLQWAFQQGRVNGSLVNNLAGAVAPAFPGFNLVLNATDVQGVLRALSEVTDVEVVSSPQLMVLDNQPARLQVGDQVPVATQSAVSTNNPNAPIVNSISYFDTGVILLVTPRIGKDGVITLQTELEVSDAVNTQSSAIDSPTIQKRTVTTTVSIESGETVALGGLIRDKVENGKVGLPVLQDVPLLGNLFKTTDQKVRQTELLILITPRIVRGPAEARTITNELRDRMTDLRREMTPYNGPRVGNANATRRSAAIPAPAPLRQSPASRYLGAPTREPNAMGRANANFAATARP